MNRKIPLNLQYLDKFSKNINIDKIFQILTQRNRNLYDEANMPMLRAIMDQPEIKARFRDYSGDVVTIGLKDEITPAQQEIISSQLTRFCPWRKGPFHIFGIDIDAEWKSHLKWNRILPWLDSLENKTICDLGCNNGYFLFKAAFQNPELALGMDPTRKFKLAFHYLNQFAGEPNLHMELLGFEDLVHFREFFDTVFCMGILYHHESPLSVLRNCRESMKKGGQIVIETMGISSPEAVCLFPQKRYANMPNVWFVPSRLAAENMIARAGFKDIQCIYNEFLSVDEQRKTAWADVESLASFLNPQNPALTIEGYEAPSRIYFIARK